MQSSLGNNALLYQRALLSHLCRLFLEVGGARVLAADLEASIVPKSFPKVGYGQVAAGSLENKKVVFLGNLIDKNYRTGYSSTGLGGMQVGLPSLAWPSGAKLS